MSQSVPSQLELNPSDPQTLEKGSNKKITITKDVADYSVESKDPSKVTVNKEADGFTVNAVEVTEGPVTVEVKTIAEEGKTETVKTLQVNVTEAAVEEEEEPEVDPEVEVDLAVEPKSVEVEEGKITSVMINTSGSYSMVSEAEANATVDSPRKVIRGVKKGKTRIKVTSSKEGFLDNIQYIDVNVIEASSEPSEFKNFTPNVKGEVGTEFVLNIKYSGDLHIESSDRSVCSVIDEEAKRVSLNKPGSCVLIVQPANGKYNEENTIEIPVFVIKKIKEKKMSYTKKEIRDLIISSLTFEQGFIPGKDDDFVICRLDKEHVGGKQLIARGVQEAILSVEGFEGSMVEVKIHVQSEYGKMNEKGHHETVGPVDRVSFIRFTSGEFNKDDLRELYKDFTEYVRAGYCK